MLLCRIHYNVYCSCVRYNFIFAKNISSSDYNITYIALVVEFNTIMIIVVVITRVDVVFATSPQSMSSYI